MLADVDNEGVKIEKTKLAFNNNLKLFNIIIQV